MGQLEVVGNISAVAGSCGGCGDQASLNLPLGPGDGCCAALGYSVSTGLAEMNVSSPSSFTVLPGVGTGGQVTQGLFLYLKTRASMSVQLTTFSGAGDVVAVLPVMAGLPMVLWFPSTAYLKGIAVQGSGTVQYLSVGQT